MVQAHSHPHELQLSWPPLSEFWPGDNTTHTLYVDFHCKQVQLTQTETAKATGY